MKILYIANVDHLKTRMHKVSSLKIEALQNHPDFVVENVNSVRPFSLLGRPPVRSLLQKHQPDIIVHDALWGAWGEILVDGLHTINGIPKALVIEDYVPFAAAFPRFIARKQFDNFIAIPYVATKLLPNTRWIGHYIPEWFQDYGAQKDIDVLFYGHHGSTVYPLRNRLKELFAKQDLRFFAVPTREHNYAGKEYVGEHMARTINRAHLTISCKSTANYMVKKYLEIPACKSTTIGDVNEEYYQVFPNGEGIVSVSLEDSDETIVDKAFKFLENPVPSEKAYELARARNPAAYAVRLSQICKEILDGRK